jgi:hypothetical protein
MKDKQEELDSLLELHYIRSMGWWPQCDPEIFKELQELREKIKQLQELIHE